MLMYANLTKQCKENGRISFNRFRRLVGYFLFLTLSFLSSIFSIPVWHVICVRAQFIRAIRQSYSVFLLWRWSPRFYVYLLHAWICFFIHRFFSFIYLLCQPFILFFFSSFCSINHIFIYTFILSSSNSIYL